MEFMSVKDSIPGNTKSSGHIIVAIGASAGGLEPIHQLFDSMPGDTGFSFVLIQHLSPDHKSLMRELEAEDNLALVENTIYLIPNKKNAILEGGRFRLNEKDRLQLPNLAIDTFFTSLAREKGPQAVGIILSGSGSDGSKGVEAIKNKGGWVVVQDPATADFDSMPVHAINTGKADLILPPEMIADELIDFVNDSPDMKKLTGYNAEEEELVGEIIGYLRTVTPHDFSQYKLPTLKRRLAKRVGEKGFKTIRDYDRYLRHHADEPTALAKEFLINVTRFFRDTEAYEELRTKVIPSIFESKAAGESIKVWVVACSTGEEAYSIAMLLYEQSEASGNPNVNIKIFATDIDKDAIQVAAAGLYPEQIAKDFSPERLSKFFIREGIGYRIAPALRKMVVFACHDVIKDPPFSKIDLVTCRNLLIYMNNALQKTVLRTFLFAMSTGGCLFLGSSENPGVISDCVKEVSKKWKIYQCTSKSRLSKGELLPRLSRRITTVNKNARKQRNAFSHLDEIFREVLVDEYSLAGILIDESMEVKHAIGRFRTSCCFRKTASPSTFSSSSTPTSASP
jgi:two-component system, chemotaxis family, CheB/CheR fusion protein